MDFQPFDTNNTNYVFELRELPSDGVFPIKTVGGMEIPHLYKIWHKLIHRSRDRQHTRICFAVEYLVESATKTPPTIEYLTEDYCRRYYRGDIYRWEMKYQNKWQEEFANPAVERALIDRRRNEVSSTNTSHPSSSLTSRNQTSVREFLTPPKSQEDQIFLRQQDIQNDPNIIPTPTSQPGSHTMARRSSIIHPTPLAELSSGRKKRAPVPNAHSIPEPVIDPNIVRDVIIPAQENVFEESMEDMLMEELERGERLTEADDIEEHVDNLYESHSQAMINARNKSIYDLVCTCLELSDLPCNSWVEKRKASQVAAYEHVINILWFMMIGWDHDILNHLVHGDIPFAYCSGEIKAKLDEYMNKGDDDKPCIYGNFLADMNGRSPTPRILRKILGKIQLYERGVNKRNNSDPESTEYAKKIDVAISPIKAGTKAANAINYAIGYRRYLTGTQHPGNCRQFVREVEKRIQFLPLDTPLERPLSEIGYATHGRKRLHQHITHHSSNYLMNLAHAICKHEFPDYTIHQYILNYVAYPCDASFAEIMASRIALCYIQVGGGFSHSAAGLSCAGSDEERIEKAEQIKAEKAARKGKKKTAAQLKLEKEKREYYGTFQTRLFNDQRLRDRVEEEVRLRGLNGWKDLYVVTRRSTDVIDGLNELVENVRLEEVQETKLRLTEWRLKKIKEAEAIKGILEYAKEKYS